MAQSAVDLPAQHSTGLALNGTAAGDVTKEKLLLKLQENCELIQELQTSQKLLLRLFENVPRCTCSCTNVFKQDDRQTLRQTKASPNLDAGSTRRRGDSRQGEAASNRLGRQRWRRERRCFRCRARGHLVRQCPKPRARRNRMDDVAIRTDDERFRAAQQDVKALQREKADLAAEASSALKSFEAMTATIDQVRAESDERLQQSEHEVASLQQLVQQLREEKESWSAEVRETIQECEATISGRINDAQRECEAELRRSHDTIDELQEELQQCRDDLHAARTNHPGEAGRFSSQVTVSDSTPTTSNWDRMRAAVVGPYS